MNSQLIRYEQARTALAECHRVDEVKDVRDKAEALAAYGRQAKDSELIQYATEIKVRAERRAGELSLALEKAPGQRTDLATSSNDATRLRTKVATLADAGISKQEASRYEALAAMPAEHFETAVATAKATAGEVTTAFMLREAARAAPQPVKGKAAEKKRQELREAQERGVSLLCTYARLAISAIAALDDFTEEERQVLQDLQTAIDRTSITTKESAHEN